MSSTSKSRSSSSSDSRTSTSFTPSGIKPREYYSREKREVFLYVYDLASDLFSIWTVVKPFARFEINEVWHTSIVVFEKEFLFGDGGIEVRDKPDTPMEKISLGYTRKSECEFDEKVSNFFYGEFSAENYNPFDRNCHDFSNQISKFLTGKEIPEMYRLFGEEMGILVSKHYPLGVPLLSFFGSQTAQYLMRWRMRSTKIVASAVRSTNQGRNK